MISSIAIKGYRGFEKFEMADLGHVNLLVGANNSGKTSLLEALHLLTSRGHPRAIWQHLWRRGEKTIEHSPRHGRESPELDASHLFAGHEFHVGSQFHLAAMSQSTKSLLDVEVTELDAKQRNSFQTPSGSVPKLGLRINGTPIPMVSLLPLGNSGAISADALDVTPRRMRHSQPNEELRVQYITTAAMDGDELVAMWNAIALTSDEELVLNTLACLDSGIERIAPQTNTTAYWGGVGSRAGFRIKHRRFENPVPIGSMGEGIWRLLSLAIVLTQCRGGVLLVDEIDTGLHHTAMADMWKMIMSAALRLDVQVFATTHSSDCIGSFAVAASSDLTNLWDTPKVSLQRIEQHSDHAVPYSQEEVQISTQHHVEIR